MSSLVTSVVWICTFLYYGYKISRQLNRNHVDALAAIKTIVTSERNVEEASHVQENINESSSTSGRADIVIVTEATRSPLYENNGQYNRDSSQNSITDGGYVNNIIGSESNNSNCGNYRHNPSSVNRSNFKIGITNYNNNNNNNNNNNTNNSNTNNSNNKHGNIIPGSCGSDAFAGENGHIYGEVSPTETVHLAVVPDFTVDTPISGYYIQPPVKHHNQLQQDSLNGIRYAC